ncbi:hypothetical protein [Bacteroides sp.]|uniref:hypothetical protein n=1 Tax=Bacteroides sp. TaxID=29523 RepID=UPI00258EF685|nr:hypothetical protein [Bacteroides sp.]
MRTIRDFEAFKLEKKQMNAIAGGKYTKIACRLTFADGEEIFFSDVHPDLSLEEAQNSFQGSYGALGEAECFEFTYVDEHL